MTLLLLACAGPSTPSESTPLDSGPQVVTSYNLDWSTEPSPLRAGEPGEFSVQITDQEGRPIEDLQLNHERMVHTMFISADWTYFAHLHHEDFADLTVDDLKNATYHFPLTLPVAGPYFMMFGYAHENRWLYNEDRMEVEGSPGQAAAPDTTPDAEVEVGDLRATLSWGAPPIAGFEANWSVEVTTLDGTPVTDLIPYLGADAHCAVVNTDLSWGSHTHAWFPDMDNMAPGMEMPHLYDGPDLPFIYTFPTAGAYKMWVQVVRASAPDDVVTLPFVFEVAG